MFLDTIFGFIDNYENDLILEIEDDSTQLPEFPLFVYYVANNSVKESKQINTMDDLTFAKHYFNSDTDGYVLDSLGRFVRLKIYEIEKRKHTVDFIGINKNNKLNAERSLVSESIRNKMLSKISDIMTRVIFVLLAIITVVSFLYSIHSSNYAFLIFIFGIEFIIFIITINLDDKVCFKARLNEQFIEFYNVNKTVQVNIGDIQKIDFIFCNIILRVDNKNLYFFTGVMYDREMMKELLRRSNVVKGLGLRFCMFIDRCNEAMSKDLDEQEEKPQ